jgi:DNA invertase Pin-like site-specific DNA recombinase
VKVIGYTRRSRERDNGCFSLEDQAAKIEAWAAYRDHELTEVIREDDTSGAMAPDDRPQLGPALASLRPGDQIVVAKFDRLSRSLADFAALIQRAHREGWALTCLDPELDLSTSTGVAFAQILGVFAELERRQYIDRMAGGKRAKAAAGGYVGGRRLARRFGSELVCGEDGGCEYVEVPAEQDVIAEIRDRYSAGETLAAIAAWLTDSSHLTTTGRERWSPQAVAAILKREGVELRPRGRVRQAAQPG